MNIATTEVTGPHAKLEYLVMELEQPSKILDIEHLVPRCTDAHTHTSTYAHTHTRTHTGMYAHTHICTYACRQAGRHRGTHPVHPRMYTHMYGRPKGSKLLLIAVSINYLGKIQFKLSFKAVYYAVKLGVFVIQNAINSQRSASS